MCRRHSHLTAEELEVTTTALGPCLRIGMLQPLTVDMKSGGKLVLRPPTFLYVPAWSVAGLSASVPEPTGRLLRFMFDVGAGYGDEVPDPQEPSMP